MSDQYNIDESIYNPYGTVSSARAIITDKTKTFVISILVALNCLATIAMFLEWRIAERETRMQEYYLLELDAKFIAAGLKKPQESIAKEMQK
jgi:hypothetical protein